MSTFSATLTPMLTLFFCIAIGFIFSKCKILPEGSGKVMAKLETWVFCPALNFTTMAYFCTVDSIGEHLINIILSSLGVLLAVGISIFLSPFFVKEKGPERGVYNYALAFANSGYMGDPIVLALFGNVGLAFFKLYCLPVQLMIYSWGISVMIPSSENKGGAWRRIINAPTVAMLLGIVVGLSGAGKYIPSFLTNSLDTLKVCMGPVAMLLAGVTIAKYDFLSMLKNKGVYIATALRLTLLPAIIVSFTLGLKMLANAVFDLNIGNDVLFLTFFATAPALGLNTVIFPEAFGGNPETGASMAMISHTLCVISIPLIYALMVTLFGVPFQG
ncbi:MAG: AEC family transporter [Clostridia bacterium]|nr:AEC family transporter [Clostridia bacterium]